MTVTPATSPRSGRRAPGAALLPCAILLVATAAGAVQLKHFALDTPKALSGASSHGVAVFPDGSLRPLPPLQELATFDEPLGLSLEVAPDGTAYVGTGHPARIWRVTARAKEMVAELPADQITDLLLGPDGTLWAATALPAALLRLSPGASEAAEVARLAEGNLWDLAFVRGRLFAAAGNPGRLMRLEGDTLVVAATVPDRHARCLEVAGDDLLVGTSGKGLVLRGSGDGPLGVLHDSQFTEIADLLAGPDGIVWAAGLTGDPTMGKAPERTTGEGTVTVEEGAPTTPSTDRGPTTSEIIKIFPSGAAVTAHRFSKQIAGTLAPSATGQLIGTGIEGELWQLVDGVPVMLDDVTAAQVTRISDGGTFVLTQGPVQLLARRGAPSGNLTSPVMDAGQPARWGEVDVTSELGSGATCSVRFRSGAVADPDDTWSEWSPAAPCARSRAGAPPARYLQWRLELASPTDGTTARVGRIAVAYQQHNLPPVIKELQVYDPGEVYLKAPPPSDKIVEVQHPDMSGIFTTLDDNEEESGGLGRKYFRVGFQSLSWKAEDPNGDALQFDVALQRLGAAAWWPVKERLESVVLAFDTQALADGTYRCRLVASDAPANPDRPETAAVLSGWFVVDNTPPTVRLTRQGRFWDIAVSDALSPLARVEWNRDGVRWEGLPPLDGLLDGPEERFRLPVGDGSHLLSVRAVDDHHNRALTAVEEQP